MVQLLITPFFLNLVDDKGIKTIKKAAFDEQTHDFTT